MRLLAIMLFLLGAQTMTPQSFDILKDLEPGITVTYTFERHIYHGGWFILDTVTVIDVFSGFYYLHADSIAIYEADSLSMHYFTVRKIGTESMRSLTRVYSSHEIDTTFHTTIEEDLASTKGSGTHVVHGWIIPDTVSQTPPCPDNPYPRIQYSYPYYFRHYEFPSVDTFDLRGDSLFLFSEWTDCYDNATSTMFTLTATSGLVKASFSSFCYFGLSYLDIYAKTGVTGADRAIPTSKSSTLLQNYPNPFNAQTAIRYEISRHSHVRLLLYDPLGRLVRMLVDDEKEAGIHTIQLSASDLPSGMYFCSILVNGGIHSRKLLVIK